jgi:hypothetical protein
MNTPNDIRWLLFATVPVHGYINLATPISRGIIWLWRRAAQVGPGMRAWAASVGGAAAPSAGTVPVPDGAGHPCPE